MLTMQLSLAGVLLVFLAIILAHYSMATQAVEEQRDCPDVHCGNLTIPYPFGFDEGCYKGKEFFIKCSSTADVQTPTPYLMRDGNVIVTNISLAEGELKVMSYIARDCYDADGPTNRTRARMKLPPPYTISNAKNKFIAVGCDTYAILSGIRGQDKLETGCFSVCDKLSVVDQSSCNGVGCCEAKIPSGLERHNVTLRSYSNHSKILDFNPCSYAFFVEEGHFNFSHKEFADLDNTERLPVVLNWAIGSRTDPCDEAKSRGDYACQANSNCVNKDALVGYLCKCKPGFEGNPYHRDGCQDIDECKFDSSLCKIGKCINSPLGNYSCECPKWYKNELMNEQSCIIDDHRRLLIISLAVSVGLFLLLAVAISLYWGIKKRRFANLKEKYFKENGGLLLQQKLASSHGGSVETAKIFTAEELEKATNNYHADEILGEGGYGTVYKGVLLDNKVVAIKKSKVGAPTQSDQFVNEVIILSQINHRNVVKLLGCCFETEVPLLVYEYITHGTLFAHVFSNKKEKGSSLSWDLRLKIATETAGALSYLHSSASTPIIHRDVKATNILLDENYTAKVSDFGASRFIPLDQTQLATLVQGTLGYLDPEYFHSNQLTEKSDVYSFGVVLAELLTSRVALSFSRPDAERCLASFFVSSIEKGCLDEILDRNIVNEGNIEIIEQVANLARRCLELKGDERPTMKEVAMDLEGMRNIMAKHPWKNGDFCPEETEYLLVSPNSVAYVVDIGGEGDGVSGGTSSGYDSMQIQLLMPCDDGR